MAKNNTKAASPVNGWPMKILAIVLAVLFVGGIAWSVIDNTGLLQRKTISLESEHYKIDNSMLAYFYRTEYTNFISQYSYYLSSIEIELDTSKSLKIQQYTSGVTWYEYFLDAAITSAKNQIVLCEAALAAGRELGDEQKADIQEAIDTIKSNAKSYSMSVDNYVSGVYGTGVKLSDVEKCLEMSALAQVQYDAMLDSYEWTDEDYDKWAEDEDNLSSIWFADYMSYKFEAKFDKDDDDEKKSEARQAAEKLAKELAENKTEQEFLDWIVKYEKSLETDDEEEDDEEEDEPTAEDYTTSKFGYTVDSDLGKWIFDAERAELETTVIYDEDNETYTAYLVLKTKYRNEYASVDVRHILISCTSTDETSDTYKEAKQKAEDVLAEYLAGELTPEAFGELAKKYTDDSNGDEGGLYENVCKDDMIEEFNDWIFDEARKEGDTGVVKTSYGFHVMYYQGTGLTAWKVTADNGLTSDQYDADYEQLEKTHEITVDYDNVYKLEE